MQTKNLFAAIDLGSNSFRLEIGRLESGHLRRVEYLKETVRQGNGLDADRNLTEEAMQRGWACLARFGERIAGFRPAHVRAVATQTLREARNRDVFLTQASKILGFPIEVIAGREEARLIYLGVSHLLPDSDERRLVVDIGGRSTELILGQGHAADTLESYRVGSVAWSMKYFPNGQWTAAAFKSAEIAAKAVLDEALNHYPRSSWDQAYGSSGTIGAVADALQANGWPQGTITLEALDWLEEKLIKAQRPESLRLEGIKDDRRPVLGGGLAVLRAVFELLQIEEMIPAQGALRHGALFDLIDRENPQTDVRDRTIDWLARHFGADPAQGERVTRTACLLFGQMMEGTAIPESDAQRYQRKLQWAARVHEIGMLISHSDYHKHGAYILENTDVQGFTVDELQRLGLLVLGHRGKLRKLEAQIEDPIFVQQLLALRMAVILCHARRDPELQGIQLQRAPKTASFELVTPAQWLQQYPQSAHLLREECVAWQKSAWRTRIHLSS
jgi:exopolyphosphatase/guanosine-5'-triphosphate,3'-diphosphate pyrophosphatase